MTAGCWGEWCRVQGAGCRATVSQKETWFSPHCERCMPMYALSVTAGQAVPANGCGVVRQSGAIAGCGQRRGDGAPVWPGTRGDNLGRRWLLRGVTWSAAVRCRCRTRGGRRGGNCAEGGAKREYSQRTKGWFPGQRSAEVGAIATSMNWALCLVALATNTASLLMPIIVG